MENRHFNEFDPFVNVEKKYILKLDFKLYKYFLDCNEMHLYHNFCIYTYKHTHTHTLARTKNNRSFKNIFAHNSLEGFLQMISQKLSV